MGGDGHWAHEVTTLSSATVAPATLPTPVLTVDRTTVKAGDQVNYDLKQQVNVLGQDTLLHYSSWTQTVQLPTEVTYQSGQLLDQNGQPITDAVISDDAKKHQVTVTLGTDYLASTMPLTGETYQLKIITRANNDVSNGEVGTANGLRNISNQQGKSNSVQTDYYTLTNGNGTVNTQVPSNTVIPAQLGVQMVSVKVLYVMDTGGEIDKDTLTGKIGEHYVATSLDFEGDRNFILQGPEEIKGVFGEGSNTITFIYKVPETFYAKKGKLDIYKTFYGDGTLKWVEILDSKFDMMFGKNADGKYLVEIHSLNFVNRGKFAYLYSGGIVSFGDKFGFYRSGNISFIFEKGSTENSIKVLKINNKTGKLTVDYISSKSSTNARNERKIAMKLGIIPNNYSTFNNFWQRFILESKKQGNTFIHRSKNRGELKKEESNIGSKNGIAAATGKLPQTNDANDNYIFYLLLLLLTGVAPLFKRKEDEK